MHIFQLPLSEIVLRVGLAFAFLYPPLSALSDPFSWVGYFPGFLLDAVAPHSLLLLHAFGVIEVVIAVWILFGKRIFVPAAVASVMLLAIVAMNPLQFPVLFRDVAIACMAISLAYAHRPKTHG